MRWRPRRGITLAPRVGVRVDPGQTLTGPDGATIPASNLRFYREVGYQVSQRFLDLAAQKFSALNDVREERSAADFQVVVDLLGDC